MVIGLTGGVGAGKSTVARALAKLGAVVYDADREVSHALADPQVKREIVARWGQEVLTEEGAVDRRALASIVFRNEADRKALEGIVHPRLGRARREAMERAVSEGAPAVVYDAPLLMEAGLDRECDAVIFVDAPEEARRTRVAQERGWSEEELGRREAAQLPVEEKRARARFVVHNKGDLAQLEAETRRVFDAILEQAKRPTA